MKKLIPFLLLSFILTISTFAQDKIAKGTSVKILEIGKLDTYYSDRADFVGIDATALGEVNKNSSGFYSGTLETTSGRTCFFSNVKLLVNSSASSKSSSTTKPSTSTTSTTSSSKSIKFVTGTIKSGTSLYLAEISPDDSYYGDRFDRVGTKGKVSKSDLTMKDDGYYAGDFIYDDGTTAYFYKAKFSKEPIERIVKPATIITTPSTSTTTTKSTSDDYSDLAYLFGGYDSDDDNWNNATNDETIKPGDKVEITAISSEDSYYDDKADYIGKKGIAGGDIEFQDLDGGYGGTVKLESGLSVNFYLVKLKKVDGSSSDMSTKSSSTSSSTTTTSGSNIPKNTKVLVTDVGPEDSYVTSKDKYIRKKGKAVDGLTSQSGGYYSGKVVFDDGTDAYFFNVKVSIIK